METAAMGAARRSATTKSQIRQGGSESNRSSDPRKKPRSGDYEDPNPDGYRSKFMVFWADECGFEDITRGSMSHTYNDKPFDAKVMPCMEIYSWKVTELRGGLEWPLDVFGFIAVRDSLDHKRNFIFNRDRDDAQTLTGTAQASPWNYLLDSCLVLTGPVRAIQLRQCAELEFQLKVKGETPSEDRILSIDFWAYNPICASLHTKDVSKTWTFDTKYSTMVLTFSHLTKAVEATIEIKITEGSTNFCGRLAAHMGSIANEVVLIDSSDRSVPVDGDGIVQISRRVVVVDKDGVLKINAKAWRGNSDGVDVAGEDDAEFTAQSARTSGAILDVGFAKLSVTVFWSLILFV
uniref:DUF6598 domain-containing protein n=1 Tax=Oryza punctata TaxID=4537 RepID=A0A0E0LX30_ORYPU